MNWPLGECVNRSSGCSFNKQLLSTCCGPGAGDTGAAKRDLGLIVRVSEGGENSEVNKYEDRLVSDANR